MIKVINTFSKDWWMKLQRLFFNLSFDFQDMKMQLSIIFFIRFVFLNMLIFQIIFWSNQAINSINKSIRMNEHFNFWIKHLFQYLFHREYFTCVIVSSFEVVRWCRWKGSESQGYLKFTYENSILNTVIALTFMALP